MPLQNINNLSGSTARDRLRSRAAALPEIKPQQLRKTQNGQQQNPMLSLLDAAREVERMQGQQETSARDRLRARAAKMDEVPVLRRTETVQESPVPQEEPQEKLNFWQRMGQTLKGAGLQYGAGLTNAAGVASDAVGGTAMIGVYRDQVAMLDRQIEALNRIVNDSGSTAQDRVEAQEALKTAYEQREIYNKAVRGNREAAKRTYDLADEMAKSGTAHTERAKSGLGTMGKIGIDLISQGAQMAGDIALGAATGGGSLAAMGARTFGSGAQEARQEGASLQKAALYGAGSAAVEVLTEKMFDGLAGIYGKGGADEIVGKAINKLTKNETARRALNVAASAAGESIEELVSGLANPALKTIYNGKSLGKNYSEMEAGEILYSMLVGGLMGGLGGTVDLAKGGVNSAAQKVNLDRTYRETGAAIKQQGMLNDLVQMGLGMSEETRASAQAMQEKLKRGGTVSDREAGMLLRQVTDEAKRVQTENLNNIKDTPAAIKTGVDTNSAGTGAGEVSNENIANTGRDVNTTQDSRTPFQREIARQMGMEPETDFARSARALNVDRETTERVQRLSEAIGREVVFYNGEAGENGYFDRESGKIHVNVNSENPVAQIIGHELTHTLEGAADYARIKDLILRRIGGQEDLAQAMTRKQESYARHGITLDQESTERELVAEFVEKNLLTDEASIREIVGYEPSFGERILNVIDTLLGKLGNKNAEERAFLRRTRELYSRALNETRGSYEAGRVRTQTDASREDLAARLEAGELTEEEYNEAMDALEEDESLNDVSMLREYSLGRTAGGHEVAIVDSDILANIDTKNWNDETKAEAKRAAKDALLQMKDGVPVQGITYKVNKTSRDEYTRSNETERLYRRDKEAFADKMRAAANLNDVIIATTGWARDGVLKHPRNDQFVDFRRGKVLLQSGNAQYDGETVVGITKDGEYVFYDVVDIKPTTFTVVETEKNPLPPSQSNEPINAIQGGSSSQYDTTDREEVKKNNGRVFSIDDSQENDPVKERAEAAFRDSKVRGEDGHLLKMFHGTKENFWEFDTSKKGGINGKNEGFGIYFADTQEVTSAYGDRQLGGYLDSKRPAKSWEKTITRKELSDLIRATCESEAQRMVDDGEYDRVADAMRDTWISNYVDTYEDRNIRTSIAKAADSILSMNDDDMNIVQEVMSGMGIRDYADAENFYKNVLTPITGIDSFWTKWTNHQTGQKQNIVVAFSSEQFKLSDSKTFDDSGSEIPLDQRFDKSKRDIRYSFDDAQQRDQTSQKVRDTLPAKARNYLQRTENAMLQRLSGALNVPSWARREYLQNMVREMSDEYLERGSVSQETVDRLFETAYEQGRIVDSEMHDEYAEVRNVMRTTAVTISETDKADFTDWNDWRKSTMGRLKIVNRGGLPVDVAYEQLQDMAPNLFPAEITHPADQLRRMKEVSDSLDKSEKTLDEYHGAEAETFKQWAKNDFAEAVNQTLSDLRTVRQYEAERQKAAEPKKVLTAAEAKETWKQVKQLRRGVDRAVSRNLLTESDELLVGKLLRGEITEESLPEGSNAKGIREVFEAKREYEKYAEQLREYKRAIRAARRESADAMLREAGQTKDKIAGLLLLSRETMERNIEDVFRDKAGAKRITEAYIEPVHKAEANKTRWLNEMRGRVRKMNLSRKIEQGNEVSEAHAVQLLGEATDNIEMLQKSHGRLRERDGKTLSDWLGVVNDLKAQNPNLDFDKIERAVQDFRKIYDEIFEQMNEVRIRNGYEPVNYRHGYFPHFQPGTSDGILAQFGKAMGITTEITALPTTINGLTHTFKPGIAWFGNAQERLGFNTAYDAVEGFDKYVQGAGDVIFHTDNIQQLRALSQQIRYRTSDEGIRKQVDEVLQDRSKSEEEKQLKINDIYEHGKFELGNFVNELEEYTNLLANKKSKYDRNMEAMIGRRAYTIMKNWESRVGANMIAGNIGSALTNFIPLTQANAQLESGQILKGMWQTLQAYKNDDGFVERSAFLTSRRGTDPLVKNWQQKASGVLGTPMELIDSFTSDSIVRARYNQNIRHGMSEQAAMDDADAFARRVMADRSKGSMPTLFQSSNPIWKLVTQFQLEVNNQFSEVFKDLPRTMRERGMAVFAGTLLRYFLGAYLFNDLYEYFVGRRSALDPIGILNDTAGDLTGYHLPNMIEAITGEDRSFRTEKKGTYEALGNLAKNSVEELPMVGGIIGGGRIPISSSLPNASNVLRSFFDENWSKEKRKDTLGKELSKPLIYGALPFGGNQAQKLWKGAKAIIEGGSYSMDSNGDKVLQYPVFNDSNAETAGNIARAALFGKSSLKPAREWVNNGFNSLSAKQTAIYEDLTAAGVKSREAYGLIDELRSAKAGDEQSKAERQREILLSSNISDKGKAIVFYGLLASDKEREGMDAMTDAGMDGGKAGQIVMELKGADGNPEKLKILAGEKLTKDQAKIAAGFVMGTDLETDSGNPTQYAKLVRAIDAGMEPAEALRLRADGMDLGKVTELKDAGLDIKTAASVATAIAQLTPEDGKSDVSDVQKWRATLNTVSGTEKQMQALKAVMPEDQYRKVEIAHGFGVQPESFVKLREILPQYDANHNGSYSQDEVKAAIDAMGGAVRGLSLPTLGGSSGLPSNHSAVLWQLMTTSKSAKNNPYSRSIGQQVLDAKERGNASGGGLSLPKLGG